MRRLQSVNVHGRRLHTEFHTSWSGGVKTGRAPFGAVSTDCDDSFGIWGEFWVIFRVIGVVIKSRAISIQSRAISGRAVFGCFRFGTVSMNSGGVRNGGRFGLIFLKSYPRKPFTCSGFRQNSSKFRNTRPLKVRVGLGGVWEASHKNGIFM